MTFIDKLFVFMNREVDLRFKKNNCCLMLISYFKLKVFSVKNMERYRASGNTFLCLRHTQ